MTFLLISTGLVLVLAWVGYFRSKKKDEEFFQTQRDYLHVTKYDKYPRHSCPLCGRVVFCKGHICVKCKNRNLDWRVNE